MHMSKYNDTKTRIVAINELKMYKFAELPVLFIGGSLTPAFLHSHTQPSLRSSPAHPRREGANWLSVAIPQERLPLIGLRDVIQVCQEDEFRMALQI